MSIPIGTRLGPYVIEAPLGAGGMGEVYRAHDSKLARDVAIKVLPASLATDPEALARFEREARSVAQLSHPNILGIFDFGREGRTAYAVMELLEGETLRARIAAGALPARTAIEYAVQIAHGLAAAHDKGLIHRDLKLENLFVTRDERVKILDFGLAKPFDLGPAGATVADPVGTTAGTILGTVGYMAPEQVRGQQTDQRSDLFAFGAVLYELLTGQRAFRGDTPADTISAILNSDPADLEIAVGDLPTALDRIVRRCLEKKPERRFQSAHDLAFALETLSIRSTGTTIAVPIRTARRARWPIQFVAGLVTGGALAAAGVLFFRAPVAPQSLVFGRMMSITRDPGLELHPALSRDGTLIAYVAGPKEKMHVYVRQLAGGHPIDLTASLPGSYGWPRWSPDGSRIAFIGGPAGTAGILTVPALGGLPKRFVDATDGYPAESPAWSPDGTTIAYVAGPGIYVRKVDEGTSRKLLEARIPHSLAWSPDGRYLAFVSENAGFVYAGRAIGNLAPSAILVVPAGGGTATEVTGRNELNTSPAWTADSRHLLFVSNLHGTRDIYELALDGNGRPAGPRRRLTTGLNPHTISLSADGTRLAYSSFTLASEAWAVDIPARPPVSVSEAVQITRNMDSIESVSPSPDGKWLAFDSNRAGNQDIYRMRLPDGEPEQLTTDPGDDFLPQWSPDGSHLVFYSWRSGNRDVYAMTSDGRSPERLTSAPGHEFYPDWSSDGQRIVFWDLRDTDGSLAVLRRQSGRWSEPQRIAEGGGYPRWSPDGRWVAYINRTIGDVWVVPGDGGQRRTLVTGQTSAGAKPSFPAWSADSRSVYFFAIDGNDRSSIWSVAVDGGAPQLLVQFDNPSRVSNRVEIDTDGRRFFFTLSQHESDVWTMESLIPNR